MAHHITGTRDYLKNIRQENRLRASDGAANISTHHFKYVHMKDTSNCIKYTILISLDYNVKALQQKPLSFKQRSVLPGIRHLKHCLREGVQKSQSGPCSN